MVSIVIIGADEIVCDIWLTLNTVEGDMHQYRNRGVYRQKCCDGTVTH